jgi:hypothetical protein
MAKDKSAADQFSDPEMEQIQHFGQALGGGVTPFDEEVEHHLQRRLREREANAAKMRAAQTGGASETGLGPTQAEQAQVKQTGALQQQSAAAGAQAAAQAQGQQASVAPPPAPVGPQGTTAPYSAQKGAVGGPGIVQTPPAAPAGPQAPEPGPEEGEET